MMNATELLTAYLSNIQNPAQAAALFADDGVVELPTVNARAQGPAEIEKFIAGLLLKVPDFRFRNIRIWIQTPDQAFGEYDVEALVPSTGKIYRQTYAGRLVAEHGKIQALARGAGHARGSAGIQPRLTRWSSNQNRPMSVAASRHNALPSSRGPSPAQCAANGVTQHELRAFTARGEAPLGFLRHVIGIGVEPPDEEAGKPRFVDECGEQRVVRVGLRGLIRRYVAHLIRPLPGRIAGS